MHLDLLIEALSVMGVGYLGVFLVTGVIIGTVTLLRKITEK